MLVKLRIHFLFVALLLVEFSQAQTNIYFINTIKHKTIEVKVGQILSLKYNGYLGQPEFVKQTITEITDSFVVLGVNPEIFGPSFQKAMSNNPKFIYKKVLLKDIISFRRITAGRQILKNTLLLANIIGISYLLTDLYHKNNFTPFESFGITLGVGIGSSVLINSIFPENPKYSLGNDWILITGSKNPKL